MTLNIAKRIIHIDTSAAVAIIIFAISTTWAVHNYTDKIDKLRDSQEQVINLMRAKTYRDSAYQEKTTNGLAIIKTGITGIRDTVKKIVAYHPAFVSEIRRKGKLGTYITTKYY